MEKKMEVRKLGVGHNKRQKKYKNDRVCKNKNCKQVLNSYNPKDFCYLHQKVSYGRIRGHEIIDL
tara:strand:+ start:408 stop:602 length:195 start_codon:yes stop_codon:yes gene_type:complete